MEHDWLLSAGRNHLSEAFARNDGRAPPSLPLGNMFMSQQQQQAPQAHNTYGHQGSVNTQDLIDALRMTSNGSSMPPVSPQPRSTDFGASNEPSSPTQMLLSLLGLMPSNGPSPRHVDASSPFGALQQQGNMLFQDQPGNGNIAPSIAELLRGSGSGFTPRNGDYNGGGTGGIRDIDIHQCVFLIR